MSGIQGLVNSPVRKSIRIFSRVIRKNRVYFVQNVSGELIGKFHIMQCGFVDGLRFRDTFIRKKEGVCALFAIKKFLKKFAQKNGINFLKFEALEDNPNNVARLYRKFACEMTGKGFSKKMPAYFIYPVNAKGRKYAKTGKIGIIKPVTNSDFIASP